MVKNQFQFPVDEAGLDDVGDLEELEKDIENLDKSCYALMKKKTIKVTVKNKKRKLGDGSGEGDGDAGDKEKAAAKQPRKVAVEAIEEDEGW